MEKIETLIDEIFDKAGEQEGLNLIDKNNLDGYYSQFNAVMAGDLQEEQVFTSEFVNDFSAGLQKILDSLN